MAKDPAFLFYYQDFIVGTSFMTNAETGAYIRTLCHLADKGTITDVQIAIICDKDIEMSMRVIEKLECVKEGVYCSRRLNIEVEKRKAHSKKQRENIMKRWNKSGNTTVLPLEDEDENENVIINEDSIKKKKYAEFVFLSQDEYLKLIVKHGEFWTKKMIQVLDNYKGAKGKKYKSDYRAILSWVEEKVKTSPDYAAYMTKRRQEEAKVKRNKTAGLVIPGAENIGKIPE